MKTKIIILMLTVMMVSCMSSEERKVKNWLNGKLSSSAEKIKSLKIVSEDSVLSLVPLEWMYNDCLRHQPMMATDSSLIKYAEYFNDAASARNHVIYKLNKPADLIKKHHTEWRKIYRTEVEGERGTIRDNVEVVLDVDGSPMLTGNEYDYDLSLHSTKLESIQTIK